MADFISSLNGVQMDNALLDMAEHTSEAYAVGERNGVPVDSSDVTYHNNARYYAQQAQSIAPASVTEAVRWDVAQTALTDAQREQARENIDAGKNGAWTNRNLLDNPWFTVNQRGFTSGAIDIQEYTRDRWKNARVSSVVYNDNGTLTYAWNGNAAGAFLSQYAMPDIAPMLVGKTVTVSAFIDGTLYSKPFVLPSTGTVEYVLGDGVTIVVINQTGTNQGFEFQFRHQSTTGKTIGPVKCELGSVSTLANDTPPDYGTELRKCYRYFRRVAPHQSGLLSLGRAIATTLATFIVGTEPMAKQTGITATISGAVYVRAGDNTNHAITAITAQSTIGSGVVLNCTTSGLTAYVSAGLILAAGAYIDISADL